MLDPKTFVCKRCAECCIKYIVKLHKADIERIIKLGYKKEDFAEIDKNLKEKENTVLKKNDKYWCVFLTKDQRGYSCKIYDSRPIVCKKYPFIQEKVETCKPITFET
ncbi:MAG: YkgJ family cysteine cluster protein [Nanoarchaeota archaeon]|nr:YkgJ family cysteine cluster protein [Nanoarchaeota archaeon]